MRENSSLFTAKDHKHFTKIDSLSYTGIYSNHSNNEDYNMNNNNNINVSGHTDIISNLTSTTTKEQ